MNNLQLTELNDKHRIAALALAAGKSNKEVSELVGLTTQYIGRLKASPLFRALLDTNRKEMRERAVSSVMEKLEQGAMEAANNVIAKIDSNDEGISLRASEIVLDRVVPKRTVADHKHEHRFIIEAHEKDAIDAVLHEAGHKTIDITPDSTVPVAQPASFNGIPALNDLLSVLEESEQE